MVAFHQRQTRFAYLLLARRSGKTVAAVCECIIRALYTKKKNAQFFYICPFRSQAKAVAWQYLVDYTLGIAVDVKKSELSITLPNNAKIFLAGSDNVDALRGLYADGVVLDEYADCRPDLLDAVVMPLLMDRLGWLVLAGTAKGRTNDFYDKHELALQDPQNWFHLVKTARQAQVIHPEELDRMQRSMSDAKWQQEMECSFDASLVGTYYADIINEIQQKGQLVDSNKPEHNPLYDPALPVHAALDLGRRDSTVITFWQETPTNINVINHYANNGEPAQHYIDHIVGTGYPIETVWLPHDAVAKTFSTDKSALEQFIAAKLPAKITPKLSVQDGIEAVRQTLPYVNFDYGTCFALVENLRMYRKRWDELNRCFSDKPLHDMSSDYADSFRYLCIVAKVKLKQLTKTQRIDQSLARTYEQNLDDLFKQRESRHNRTSIQKLRI